MTTRKVSRELENSSGREETQHSTDQYDSKPSNKQNLDMALPGPVYFLVREQAKSLVAIKELQERIRSLECVQDDVFQAVNGLQFQMDRSLQLVSCYPDIMKSNRYALPDRSEGGMPAKSAESRRSIRSGSGNGASVMTTHDSKKGEHSESDSKQDSGLDSDCQANASLVPSTKKEKEVDEDGDELLELLEVIAQKGDGLWKRVEECERLRALEEDEAKETMSSQDLEGLVQECRNLQRRLKVVNHEKGNLRSQLVYMERVAQEMKLGNSHLEEKLEAVVRDKQKLESQIHRLHSQFVPNKEGGAGKQDSNWQQSTPEQKPKKLGRPRNSEESRNRVAAILKESNVLELQRQLLMYIMENEVLNTKLEQLEQIRIDSTNEAEKTESRMRSEIRQIVKERNELQAAVEEGRMELTAVQAKTRMLERALNAVSHDPEDFGSLEVSGNSIRSQPSPGSENRRNFRNPLLSSSLPPIPTNGSERYLRPIQSRQHSSTDLDVVSDEGVDVPISAYGSDRRWASTPLRSQIDVPGFGSFGRLSPTPREFPVCTKGTKMLRNETFATDFEMRLPTRRDTYAYGAKGGEFVDSLDVTPSKIFGTSTIAESPSTVKVPMAYMGNIPMRTTFARQSQRTLRFSDSTKRYSDSFVPDTYRRVDEALL